MGGGDALAPLSPSPAPPQPAIISPGRRRVVVWWHRASRSAAPGWRASRSQTAPHQGWRIDAEAQAQVRAVARHHHRPTRSQLPLQARQPQVRQASVPRRLGRRQSRANEPAKPLARFGCPNHNSIGSTTCEANSYDEISGAARLIFEIATQRRNKAVHVTNRRHGVPSARFRASIVKLCGFAVFAGFHADQALFELIDGVIRVHALARVRW